MKYINNFSSLIPALQGAKAIRQVEKLRQIGEIQTEAEYNTRLSQILQRLSTEDFVPTFRYNPFKPGISSSEQYNQMMDQIRDDLEVAFTEANNIFATVKAHDFIFKDKVINELYASIEELEKEISRLTVVADSDNSFDDAFINTFSGDAYRLDRLDQYANELLYDRRLDEKTLDSNNTNVDLDEELISLPLSSQSEIDFSSLNVVGTQSTGSDYDVQLVDSNIDSVISGAANAGWIYNVLKVNNLTNGAKLVLDADLGDKRLVNYLFIKPISDFPSVLESIQYIDENNQMLVLPETSLFGQAITSPVKISFEDIIAKKFILTFTQRSSSLFSYNSTASTITIDDLRRDTSLVANAQMLEDQIRDSIDSVDLLSVIPISSPATPQYQVVYQYTFGFSEISTGLSGFKEKGYFVSKAYEKDSLGLLALDVDEVDTNYFDEVAAVVASVGSFEYDIVKKDYNERNEMIRSTDFPILPIGRTSVANERLLITATNTVQTLRFLGHTSLDDGSAVQVFRNNVPLVIGADWTFPDRNTVLDLNDTQLKPGLTETRIQILHSSDVIRNGIYTVNYIPRHIAEPNSIISAKDIVTLSTNVTEHKTTVGAEAVFRSELFIKIAIRNNSFYNNKTPKLASYKLLASSVDSSKFIRL